MSALSLCIALLMTKSVHLSAERMVHDDARKITVAEGNAALRAEGVALDAEQISWDETGSIIAASGAVTLRLQRGGPVVMLSEAATLMLSGDEVHEIFLYEGVAFRKRNAPWEQLEQATTHEQAKNVGNSTMSMKAHHLTRIDDDKWKVDDLALTPCECKASASSWYIASSNTSLDFAAERASMLFPTVYVGPVPVLWFPYLSLPLSSRQSGLLIPKPSFTALNGFHLEQPVFLTLGEHADMTFTPGYYFGGEILGAGVMGPHLATELRYTTSLAINRIGLGLIWDLKPQMDPTTQMNFNPTRRRGLRADGSWVHLQNLGNGFYDRLNVSFLSDGALQRDTNPDVLLRETGYLRSSAVIFHRGSDHWAGIDLVARQDLTTDDPLFSTRPATFDASGSLVAPGAPVPIARFPAVSLAFPTQRLAGPIAVGGRAEIVRMSPLWKTATSPPAYERLDVVPRVDLAWVFADTLSTSAFAAWRQDVWLEEKGGKLTSRGYPILGARAETELSKTFQKSVRHSISPSLEFRSVPMMVGDAVFPQYDEVDAAAFSGAAQAVAMVRQRLTLPSGQELIRLDLGQGFDFLPSVTTGESFARVTLMLGPVSSTGTIRVDPLLKYVTRASASVRVMDSIGRGASLSFESLTDLGNDRARQPIDLLIGPRLLGVTATVAQVLQFDAGWQFGNLKLRYNLMYLGFDMSKREKQWPGDSDAGWKAALPDQQTLGVSWGSSCECWRVEVYGTYRPDQFPDLGASLIISGFGRIGAN